MRRMRSVRRMRRVLSERVRLAAFNPVRHAFTSSSPVLGACAELNQNPQNFLQRYQQRRNQGQSAKTLAINFFMIRPHLFAQDAQLVKHLPNHRYTTKNRCRHPSSQLEHSSKYFHFQSNTLLTILPIPLPKGAQREVVQTRLYAQMAC